MEKPTKQTDKIDVITMDVPLFIRMLEYAKEDAKSDMDLHTVTENVLRLSNKVGKLTMNNYKNIVSRKQETKEQTMADASGSFEAPLSTPVIKRPKITNIPNFNEQDLSEVTSSAVSAGAVYDVPFGPKNDPLKINGPKSIGKSRAVKDKNFPKWGGPGSVFVKVKEKCKKFPYCNQGDINAIEILKEIDELNEAIDYISQKQGIPRDQVEKLVINEIKKIII